MRFFERMPSVLACVSWSGPGVVLSVGVLEVQCVACTVLDQGHFHHHAGCGEGFGLVVCCNVGVADVVGVQCESHICAVLWMSVAYFSVQHGCCIHFQVCHVPLVCTIAFLGALDGVSPAVCGAGDLCRTTWRCLCWVGW